MVVCLNPHRDEEVYLNPHRDSGSNPHQDELLRKVEADRINGTAIHFSAVRGALQIAMLSSTYFTF